MSDSRPDRNPAQQREEALFTAALAKPAAERAAFLDGACHGDPALRQRLEALLAAHEQPGQLRPTVVDAVRLGEDASARPARPPLKNEVADEPVGQKIGRYKILEKVGEGGCGVVYVAEQTEPVRRRVALKVIKLGMDTKQVVARFEAERQALALMDHPNIAKFLDAGVTGVRGQETGDRRQEAGKREQASGSVLTPDPCLLSPGSGRPYFVMELVRGIRITDYCDLNNLSIRDRLDLFIKVCQAIQHAHQKGIIHRDIKPSNILVTLHDGPAAAGCPKVIDFGIAKATEGRLTDATVYTQLHQLIGTPAYMSPEQAEMSGLDIDTRSDIYSLGVLLYELLTGQTPFSNEELMRAGLEEMRRTIRETEPIRPSTRLKMTATLDLAKRRGEPRERLEALIRGDLDWIVMKCLEKDRTRRYQAANELASELQRYLHNEPVLARPPSAAYRFQKLVRRNRLAFAATAAVVVALLGGVIATSWQAIRATHAEQQQKRLRQQAEQNAVLAQVEANKSKQVASFLREMLRGVRPSVALGRDVTVLREIVDRATVRLDKDLNDQPAIQATLQNTLGQIYRELGEYDQAERLLSKALAVRRQLLGETNAEVAATLHELGEVLRERNRLEEAEKLHRQALAIREQVLGTQNEQVPASLDLLAKTLSERGQLQEAEGLLRQGLAIEKKLHGEVHLDVASRLRELGFVLQQAGHLAEAERIYNEALVLCERPIAADTLKPILLKDLASVRTAQKRPMEGIELLRRALPLFGKVFQTNNADPEITAIFERMNKLLAEHGDKVPLEELMTNVLAVQRKLAGDRNPELAASLQILGTTAQSQGRPAEAEKFFRESLEMRRRLWGEEHPLVVSTMASLSSALSEQGKLAEAEDILLRRLEISRRLYATDPSKLDRPLLDLADVLYRQGKYAPAEPLYRELIKLRAEHPAPGIGSSTDFMASLGRLLADWALRERAEPAARDRAREAEKLLRDCLAARLGATNISRTKLGDTRSRLGGAVLSVAVCDPAQNSDRFKEAETLLLTGHELMQADSPIAPRYLRDSFQRLIRLYDAWKSVAPDGGYEVKAASWKRRLEEFEKPRSVP